MTMNKNNKFDEWKKSRKKIYWRNIPPEELTWSESMLEIEGVVNEEISRLQKQQTQQSRELAELLTKSLYIIKRGY